MGPWTRRAAQGLAIAILCGGAYATVAAAAIAYSYLRVRQAARHERS